MNNSQVAHAWARQQKTGARGSHFYFDGPSIFSYGRHFEIARHVQGMSGARGVLFTARDYSVSTARHKSYTRRALLNWDNVFTVPRVDVGDYASGNAAAHAENLTYYLETARRKMDAARRALGRVKQHTSAAASLIQKAAQYGAFFGSRAILKDASAKTRETWRALRALERTRAAGKLFTAEELAQFNAREARAQETQKRRDDARAARWARQSAEWQRRAEERLAEEHVEEMERPQRIAAARAMLDVWAAGASDALPEYKYFEELPTRVRVHGEDFETSRGARVSLSRALELWRLMSAGIGENAPVIGFDIDGFRVSSWDGARLIFGCHTLEREELARLAALVGA